MNFSCALLRHPCCAAAVQDLACIMHLTAAPAVRYLQRALGRLFDAKAGALRQPVATGCRNSCAWKCCLILLSGVYCRYAALVALIHVTQTARG